MIEVIGFAIVYTAILGWIATRGENLEMPNNVRHELYHRLL